MSAEAARMRGGLRVRYLFFAVVICVLFLVIPDAGITRMRAVLGDGAVLRLDFALLIGSIVFGLLSALAATRVLSGRDATSAITEERAAVASSLFGLAFLIPGIGVAQFRGLVGWTGYLLLVLMGLIASTNEALWIRRLRAAQAVIEQEER